MLALLSGKPRVDQLARRFGVRAATVAGWREQTLEGISESLRQGSGKSSHELERDLGSLEKAFTHLAIKRELVERALKDTLTTVASLGSATSLLVYSLVNIGAWRIMAERNWHRVVIQLSVVACLLAEVVWISYTLKTSPGSLWIFVCFLVIAFVSEGLLQRYHGRRILPRDLWKAS